MHSLHNLAIPDGIVAWKTNSYDVNLASLRYRVLHRVLGLDSLGIKSRIFPGVTEVDFSQPLIAVVFVKCASISDLADAHYAHSQGIPIILDLCDNIFLPQYPSKTAFHIAEVFLDMAEIADAVVTTNDAMANVIRENVRRQELRTVVIPDGVETPKLVNASAKLIKKHQRSSKNAPRLIDRLWKHKGALGALLKEQIHIYQNRLSSTFEFRQLRAESFIQRRKVILWFGNAGGAYAKFGLASLQEILPALERSARKYDLILIVISNSRVKYERLADKAKIPTVYIDWTPRVVYRVLEFADLVVLPNSLDEFSRCKSENRVLMALQQRVPVVTTKSPATERLQDCVLFDDFEAGIDKYFSNKELVATHLKTASEVIKSRYSEPRLAMRWASLINQCYAEKRLLEQSPKKHHKKTQQIIVFSSLLTDLDLLLPLLTALKADPRFTPIAVVTKWLLNNSRRVWDSLHEKEIPPYVIDEKDSGTLRMRPLLQNADALITAVESNSRPHKAAHELTKQAKTFGVPTYTLQHGLENIGLTFFDHRYTPESVEMASDTIFIWGELSTLDSAVTNDIRQKCVPVGMTKSFDESFSQALPVKSGKRVVAVFENLHWDRYSKNYREQFTACLLEAAERLPDITFILKPHHAGRWFTHRRKGTVSLPKNIIVADPANDEWQAFTAPAIITNVAAVITSPSTVTLDTAILGKPVAVHVGSMDLSFYDPLPSLSSADSWVEFVESALAGADDISTVSAEFVNNKVLPGDATKRILDKIAHELDPTRLNSINERKVEWIIPLPRVISSEPMIFSACDSDYLEYAIPLIRSLEVFSPGLTFLLHIVNPNPNAIERVLTLQKELQDTCIGLSIERIDLTMLSRDERRTYFAMARFVRLKEILTTEGPPIFCIDADSLIVNSIDDDFSDKEDVDISLVIRDRRVTSTLDPLSVAVGSIWLNPTEQTLKLIIDVADDLISAFAAGDIYWFIDQEIFGHRILDPNRKIRAYNIKRKFADWDFSEGSILWSGKGDRKNFDLRYLILQRALADKVQSRSSASRMFEELGRVRFGSFRSFENKYALIGNKSKQLFLQRRRRVTLYVPRLDLPWKAPGNKAVKIAKLSADVIDLRLHWKRFAIMLANELESRGVYVNVEEIPMWTLEPSLIESKSDHLAIVPHRCNIDFETTEKPVLFYMQEYFRWVFTLDASGWSAASSIYPLNLADLKPTEKGVYDRYRELLLQGNLESKFEQANSSTVSQLQKNGEIPREGYIFYPLQIPHDQSIRYFSSTSEELVIDVLTNWALANNVNLVLKPHPANMDSMNQFKQYVDNRRVFWSTSNVHDLIGNSLAVFTINSGVGFEALFHTKPIVTFGRAEYDCVTFNGNLNNIDEAYDYCINSDVKSLDASYRTFVDWFLGDYAIDMSQPELANRRLSAAADTVFKML
ncbi:MAG: hypothetical protein ABJ308_10045 [Halieaceae bacterium]